MSMTVAPPAQLNAVIEEARRRARRRRLAYLAAAAAAVVAASVWLILTTAGSGQFSKGPPGFTIAKAQGPVAHAVLKYDTGVWRSTDVVTGLDRSAKATEEVWYDPKSGLWRDIFRIDGRIKNELAGRCEPSAETILCGSDSPLTYLRPYPWPPGQRGYREAGRGSFHGQDVIWLEPRGGLRTPANMAVSRIGLDPKTHRIVVAESFSRGRLVGALLISQRSDLDAADVRFLIPHRSVPVTPRASFDPWSGLVYGYGFPAVRRTLGRPPLWLGPRFRGYALTSVTSGVYRPLPGDGRPSRPMRFVRFYYGERPGRGPIIRIEELGPSRPYFQKQGPRLGFVERTGITVARLSRGGLLVRVVTDLRFPLTAKNAVALARALRPLPPGLSTLPTLRQL